MCYSLLKHTLLWPVTSRHPLAHTRSVFFFCPLCPPSCPTLSAHARYLQSPWGKCQPPWSNCQSASTDSCWVKLHSVTRDCKCCCQGTWCSLQQQSTFYAFALYPLKCINFRVHTGFIKSVFGLNAGIVNVRSLLYIWSLQISPLPSPCFPCQSSLPSVFFFLSAYVLGSVSICLGSGDRKTWCVVISEAWQHGEGSYLGPLE